MKRALTMATCSALVAGSVVCAWGRTDSVDVSATAVSDSAHADTAAAARDAGQSWESFLNAARESFDAHDYEKTVSYVLEARAAKGSDDLRMAFLAGASLGRTGRYRDAVAELSKHLTLDGPPELKKTMRGCLALYEDRLFEQTVKEALAAETGRGAAALNDSVVAVVAFRYASDNARFAPLAKGLADMVVTDLSQVRALRLVERSRAQRLADEIGLDKAGVTDNTGRTRAARLLGASRIVSGTYRCADTVTLAIRGGFLDVRKGQTVSADQVNGQLKEFFSVEKKFIFAVIEKMRIVLSDEEREGIQRIPTENLLAFISYSEGLDAQDRGDYAAAGAAFARAAELDPGFVEAGARAADMEAASRIERDLSTPAEPPVLFHGSGPGMVVEQPKVVAVTTEVAGAKAAGSVQTVSPRPAETRPQTGFSASGPTGRRISTIVGAAFMSELPVRAAADPAPSAGPSEPNDTPDQSRPAYEQYQGLGFGDGLDRVNIIVELPEAL